MRGSLSTSSKPIFATKYSFCSIFRDLQDWHTFAPLESIRKTTKSHLFKVAGPKTRHGKRSNKRPTRQGGAAKKLRKWKAATTRRSAPEAYCAAENKRGACTEGILQHAPISIKVKTVKLLARMNKWIVIFPIFFCIFAARVWTNPKRWKERKSSYFWGRILQNFCLSLMNICRNFANVL